MNKEMDNINEEIKHEITFHLLEESCFNKEWIVRFNKQKRVNPLICLICKQIANDALKLECYQHKHINKSQIAGGHCLNQFLKSNNGYCPVQAHANCEYSENEPLRNQINNLTVMCIRQFEQELRVSNKTEKEEGEAIGVIKCDFKGKIKELKTHLDNECPLKVMDCWFKPFGCNCTCHKKEKKKKKKKDETNQLKLENEKLKKDIQSKDNEIHKLNNQIIELLYLANRMQQNYWKPKILQLDQNCEKAA
ncbi:hypothetical protein RFI_09413 [Reticulomyxa filosa]|uniref:TRAF-type domain-containing protein n=1 Tax=Reticulomyxa filosa TaxID=46433 RepID=X6NNX2_RETFI|nr:hypothetical protein RFI_09413 [Reticulomyxa filosa]|eukprot:ETO27721.1 hypothetical protein RFI_09413 [Reticulomyxa filosa]